MSIGIERFMSFLMEKYPLLLNYPRDFGARSDVRGIYLNLKISIFTGFCEEREGGTWREREVCPQSYHLRD